MGTARMVRVTGPSGQCGMVPYQSDDHDHIVEYVTDVVRFETLRALHELDDEFRKFKP